LVEPRTISPTTISLAVGISSMNMKIKSRVPPTAAIRMRRPDHRDPLNEQAEHEETSPNPLLKIGRSRRRGSMGR
jgi:hypothetical protein